MLSHDMSVTLREMKADETAATRALAKRCFSLFFSVMIEKPKEAIIALDGRRIVSGAIFKRIKTARGSMGCLSWGFTDPEYRGQKIGKRVYKKAFSTMSSSGCDAVCALVNEDNEASWRAAQASGLKRTTFSELVRRFSLSGALKIWLSSSAFFAIGSSLWTNLSLTRPFCPPEREPVCSLSLILLMNLLIPLVYSLLFSTSIHTAALMSAAALSLMAGLFLIRLLPLFGTRPRFYLPRGGLLIMFIITLTGGLYPVTGSWYRREDDQSAREDKKRILLSALLGWSALLVILALGNLLHSTLFLRILTAYIQVPLVFNLLYSLDESSDGARVHRSSPPLYWIFTTVSVLIIVYSIFFS